MECSVPAEDTVRCLENGLENGLSLPIFFRHTEGAGTK